MNKTILIYNDSHSKTCSAELTRSLAKTFRNYAVGIVSTDRHNFDKNITELSPAIIIIPEIKGEESFYSRHISKQTQQHIKDHVKNGALLVSFCAGAYWMCEKITYNPPHGPTKIREGHDVFNAVSMMSYGPLPGHGRPSNNTEDFGGCLPIKIIVNTVNGPKTETVWYGNGPAFYPIKNKLPDHIEVIARYAHSEGTPIAACGFPSGNGGFILSGPLAHYSLQPINKNNLLWQVITHKIHQHLFAKQTPSMISVPL